MANVSRVVALSNRVNIAVSQDCFLYQDVPFAEISLKSIHSFLSDPGNRDQSPPDTVLRKYHFNVSLVPFQTNFLK